MAISKITNDGIGDIDELTVDTNTLVVDSTNNRVGIGTSLPAKDLHIVGGDFSGLRIVHETDGTTFNLQSDSSGNTQLNATTATDITFLTTNFERMRIDSSGNVGIGTVPPSTYWGASNNIGLFTPLGYLGSNGNYAVSLYSNGYRNSSGGFTYLGINGNTSTASGIDLQPDANIIFRAGTASGTALPERMRIDSSGFAHFNTGGSQAGASVAGTSIRYTDILKSTSTTGGANQIVFYNPNGAVGAIRTTGSSTAYNTSSDYRLKENVTGITDGIERVKQLNPSRFNFIADADTTVDGFLAHEAATVVPEAVSGEKDAVDEDGNPEYQGIDQAKLVPLLTAALQEAIAKIEALETENANFEARIAALEAN